VFGETTAEFVRRQRLEFAHELLRSSDLQVQQIAPARRLRASRQLHRRVHAQFGYSPKKVGRATSALPRT